MRLAVAQRAAAKLVELLEPVCEPGYCRFAGSVRRAAADCKDVELVIIPRWGSRRSDGDLFPMIHNLAQLAIEDVGETLRPIKPGVPLWGEIGEISVAPCALPKWPLKAEGKYWRLWMPNLQATADIFVCTPETWGLNFTLRTGSADFSHGLATRWNKLGGVFAGARLVDRTGKTLETPEEQDVFDLLEIEWVLPPERTDAGAIRPLQSSSSTASSADSSSSSS